VGHDFGAASHQSDGVVDVHISVETTDPPAGRVVTGEGEPGQAFVGWLQLLSILANALVPPPQAAVTHRPETAP
jgi:hypothetical protein